MMNPCDIFMPHAADPRNCYTNNNSPGGEINYTNGCCCDYGIFRGGKLFNLNDLFQTVTAPGRTDEEISANVVYIQEEE